MSERAGTVESRRARRSGRLESHRARARGAAQGVCQVRRATPADAAAIVDMTLRCYGDTYCGAAALDPAQVARSIASGQVAYALASCDGELVGKAGLERLNDHGCWHYGRVVVDAAARGKGVMGAMAAHLLDVLAPATGARWLIASPVTNHDFAQRSCRSLGFAPLGLLLGVYPAKTTMAGIGRATQPVSVALRGRYLDATPARPRALALEGEDAALARATLLALGVASAPGARLSGRLTPVVREDPAIGLVHVQLAPGAPGGEDDDLRDDDLLTRLDARGRRLAWFDVPAEHERASALIARLRARGFGWAAYLPAAGPGGEDVVRLQRYEDPWPLAREEVLVLDDAAALADLVLGQASSHSARSCSRSPRSDQGALA